MDVISIVMSSVVYRVTSTHPLYNMVSDFTVKYVTVCTWYDFDRGHLLYIIWVSHIA